LAERLQTTEAALQMALARAQGAEAKAQALVQDVANAHAAKQRLMQALPDAFAGDVVRAISAAETRISEVEAELAELRWRLQCAEAASEAKLAEAWACAHEAEARAAQAEAREANARARVREADAEAWIRDHGGGARAPQTDIRRAEVRQPQLTAAQAVQRAADTEAHARAAAKAAEARREEAELAARRKASLDEAAQEAYLQAAQEDSSAMLRHRRPLLGADEDGLEEPVADAPEQSRAADSEALAAAEQGPLTKAKTRGGNLMPAADSEAAEHTKKEMQSSLDEMRSVLQESCGYTADEVEDDPDVAELRMWLEDHDVNPSTAKLTKWDFPHLHATKKQSRTAWFQKKYLRRTGRLGAHWFNQLAGKSHKERKKMLKEFITSKKKAKAKARKKRENEFAMAESVVPTDSSALGE